ncbi:MAG: plasmid mobilization relaxosome protein MobC [Pseudobutyrivibrio sp.]|nr:plasmid mobilization relaxosome protein MobC [Pseudobutyrivibrio sp.]
MKERPELIKVYVSEKEKVRIEEKMKELGIKNRSAYMRKMALDGIIVNLEIPELNEILRLMRYTSNNMNQYAKKANETGCIYKGDIERLQKRFDEIWTELRMILLELSKIY